MVRRDKRDGVFQRKDVSGWYVSYVDSNGARRKKRVEANTRTQALDVLAAIKTRVQTEAILGVKHTSEISTADLFNRYKRHQKHRIRPTTMIRINSIVDNLIFLLPTQLKEISKAKVADLISSRSQEVAPATVQKEVAVLKHALRLAVEWELIHSNPAERARVPRLPEGRTRYLSPTELKGALAAAPSWMRPPIALASFTGMRRGEILALRWKDVDLDGRRIFLHDTKNGSLRVLALNGLAAALLRSLPGGNPADLVLPDVDGPRLSVYTKRLFASLNIENASFHSLRHTAASWMVMQGVDLYAVGQVLGHKTPRMTQRYAHLSPQYMAAAIGKLDQVFQRTMPRKSRDSHGTNSRTKQYEPKRIGAPRKRA
jgi:integrase